MKRLVFMVLSAVFLSGGAAMAETVDDMVSLDASALSVNERRVVYKVSVTNHSDQVLTGVAAVLSMSNSRPVPISEVALASLLQIPGGLMPGETVFVTEQLNTRDSLVASRLRDDSNVRLTVRVVTALDQSGQSLACKALDRMPDWRHFLTHFGWTVPQPASQRCYTS